METQTFRELIGFSNKRFYWGSVMMLFTALVLSELILNVVDILNIYVNASPDDYSILQKGLNALSIPAAAVFSYLVFSVLLGLCFRFIGNGFLAVLLTIVVFVPINFAINSVTLFSSSSAGFTALNVISVLFTAIPLVGILIGIVAVNLVFKKQLPTVILGGSAGYVAGSAVAFIVRLINVSVFSSSPDNPGIRLSVYIFLFIGFVAAGIIFGVVWYIFLRLADENEMAEKSPYISKKNYIGNIAAALFATPIILLSFGISFVNFVKIGNLSADLSSFPVLSPLISVALIIIGIVTFYLFIYRIWDSIKDGQTARTTPGFAVGGLFIPFYNFYWIFQVLPGFAADFNNYKTQRRINTVPLSSRLLMTVCILTLASIVPALGILCAVINGLILLPMISQVLNAVNAAKETQTA